MPPADDQAPAPRPVNPWLALTQQWQRTGETWIRFWTTSLRLATSESGQASSEERRPPLVPLIEPATLASVTRRYQDHVAQLWQSTLTGRSTSSAADDKVQPNGGDGTVGWPQVPWFAFLRQSYVLYGEYLLELASKAGLPPGDLERFARSARETIDAIALTRPSTDPSQIAEGESVAAPKTPADRLTAFVADLERSRITKSGAAAFAPGKNLAVAPGSVVLRNELIELLQYAPTTEKVHGRPLVIVPPCINKYYVLDLQPDNSLVRHVVAEGHTTFMISWRNVSPALGKLDWDDYLQQGVLPAIAAAREITGSRSVNALGFSIGSTALATALGVLAARKDASVASATLLAAMLDFAEPGEIAAYLTPQFVAASEPAFLAGERMRTRANAGVHSQLRATDFVWNYLINAELNSQAPDARDLAFWNGDTCNLPGPMYASFLRRIVLENRLREPRALTFLGEPIDLRRLRMPTYLLALRDDTVAPWQSAYKSVARFGGDSTFVLAEGGHVTGVVDPPETSRHRHWINDLLTDDADDWLARAEAVTGSWWPHWFAWLAQRAGTQRRAPKTPGSATHPELDAAPGRYVLEGPD